MNSDEIEKSSRRPRSRERLPSIDKCGSKTTSVLVQARKILTQHIYGMVDRGEHDGQRLTVGGLVHLKAVERDHKNTSPPRMLPFGGQKRRHLL